MPVAAATGDATWNPAQGPGMLTMNRVVPAAGSYRPGTPIPIVRTPGHAAMAATAVSAS